MSDETGTGAILPGDEGPQTVEHSMTVRDEVAKSDAHADAQLYDYVVIGGGIVGLATAMELLNKRPEASVLVLEKESRVAFHQTGHNSGVIHAGIYYKPGSLKATLCKAGAERTRQFADEHGIPYRNVGKLIVATNEAELERMNALFERAQQNGMNVEKIDAAELKRREPRVNGIGAIWSPNIATPPVPWTSTVWPGRSGVATWSAVQADTAAHGSDAASV